MDGDTLYYVNPTACHKYALPQNVTWIHSNVMENKCLQASFNIPESVDFIGNRAFYGLQIVQTRNALPVYYMSCSINTSPFIGNEVFDESSLVTGSEDGSKTDSPTLVEVIIDIDKTQGNAIYSSLL